MRYPIIQKRAKVSAINLCDVAPIKGGGRSSWPPAASFARGTDRPLGALWASEIFFSATTSAAHSNRTAQNRCKGNCCEYSGKLRGRYGKGPRHAARQGGQRPRKDHGNRPEGVRNCSVPLDFPPPGFFNFAPSFSRFRAIFFLPRDFFFLISAGFFFKNPGGLSAVHLFRSSPCAAR